MTIYQKDQNQRNIKICPWPSLCSIRGCGTAFPANATCWNAGKSRSAFRQGHRSKLEALAGWTKPSASHGAHRRSRALAVLVWSPIGVKVCLTYLTIVKTSSQYINVTAVQLF